jgi:hypothetical protein
MKKAPVERWTPFFGLILLLSICLLAACERPASRSIWSPITESYQTVTAEALASLGTPLPTSEGTTQPQTTIAPTSTSQPVEIPAQLPHSMKGYNLYSWQDGEDWYFTLVTGTNAGISFEEIIAPGDIVSGDGYVKITVVGMDELKELLSRLPAGEEVIWSGMDLGGQVPEGTIYLTLPPQDMIDELIAYCTSLGIKLTAIKP